MGKIKRQRQKFHLSKTGSKPIQENLEVSSPVENEYTSPLLLAPTENIFEGLNISADDLKQKLPDFDTLSVVSYKSVKQGKHLKKKEKQKLRHEAFMKKLNVVHQMRKEAKERRKKRNSTTVVNDMKDLFDSLPPINIHLKEKQKKLEKRAKKRSIPKMKHRQKDMLRNIESFQKALSNPDFQADPVLSITNYLQEKIKSQKL